MLDDALTRALEVAAGLALVAQDAAGRVLGANEQARRLLAMLKDPALGAPELRRLRDAALAAGTSEGRVTLSRSDGSPFYVTVLASRTAVARAEAPGVLLVLAPSGRDPLGRAETRHELRTTLSGVLGFAELVCSERLGAVSAPHHEVLQDIIAGARHALRLVASAAEPAGTTTPGEVRQAAEATRALAKGTVIIIAANDDRAVIAREVIHHLGLATRTVSSVTEGCRLVESGVHDAVMVGARGPGGALIASLREAFAARGDELDTAVVAALPESEGVLVEPVTGAASRTESSIELAEGLKRSSAPLPVRALLVCDQNTPVGFERTLASTGAEIVRAATAKEAFSLFRSQGQRFTVALVDLAMQDMQGVEILSQLRYLDLPHQPPIVVLVGPSDATTEAPSPTDNVFVLAAARGRVHGLGSPRAIRPPSSERSEVRHAG